MSFELLKLSSKEYINILESGEFSDTEILVGEEPNTKVFKAHSLVLKIRSSYFRTALSENWIKTENNVIKLRIPNISIKVFSILVRYIYSGNIDLTIYDIKTNIALLIAADELCLNDLCSYIEIKLLKNEKLLKNNFVLIHNIVNKFCQFTKLSQFYRINFPKEPSLILKAKDFTTIQQEVFLNFLIENSQYLSHIDVWDKLIEWAIAQSHELPFDVLKWTSSEVATFGTIIQPFIQHINFKDISPSDFCQRIKPFKNIFDEKFYTKILEYYSFSSFNEFKININSKIISPGHAFLLGNLIKITKQSGANIFYDFKLLVRGSRDGFDYDTFHEHCDRKGSTITIASVKNTSEILGGFNPLDWEGEDFNNTEESFIFSLDRNNLTTLIFSRVVEEDNAIYCSNSSGPDFGMEDSDLRLLESNTKTGQCYKNSYEKLIRQNEGVFEIDDYEVFQVISKSS